MTSSKLKFVKIDAPMPIFGDYIRGSIWLGKDTRE